MKRILFILFTSFLTLPVYAVDSGSYICDSQSCNRDGVWNYGVSIDSASAHFICETQGAAFPNGSRPGTFSQTECRETSNNALIFMHHPDTSTCPSGSSASAGMCVCTAPNVDSADHKTCVAPSQTCTAGTTVSTGYYDLGTDPSSSPNVSTCSGGCGATYEGSGVQARRLVDGVYHYFSTGSYVSTAESCSSGNDTSTSNQTLPTDECGSGQTKVTMGLKSKCYNNDGSSTNPNSASAVSSANTANNAAAQSAISAAQDMESNAGITPGSGASGAGSVAAGNIAANDHESGKDDVMRNFCKDNPESKICIDQDFGEVEETTLENKDVSIGFEPVSIGSAGSCPAPTTFTIAGRTGTFSWTTYCNFATGIKPILLVFAWLSAAGILIGGFKT